jgi:hypothetical protein
MCNRDDGIYNVDAQMEAKLSGTSNAAQVMANAGTPFRKSLAEAREEWQEQGRLEEEKQRLDRCGARLEALREARARASDSSPVSRKAALTSSPMSKMAPQSFHPLPNFKGKGKESTTTKDDETFPKPLHGNALPSVTSLPANVGVGPSKLASQPAKKSADRPGLAPNPPNPVSRLPEMQQFMSNKSKKPKQVNKKPASTREQLAARQKKEVEKACADMKEKLIKESVATGLSEEEIEKRVEGYRKKREVSVSGTLKHSKTNIFRTIIKNAEQLLPGEKWKPPPRLSSTTQPHTSRPHHLYYRFQPLPTPYLARMLPPRRPTKMFRA